jgi:hypothetical protein
VDYNDMQATANGLIRAATLVSMMPCDRATLTVINQRCHAVDSGQTLTHWANQVSPLGEEMEEESDMGAASIESMKRLPGPNILLEFDDLSDKQKMLVIGTY